MNEDRAKYNQYVENINKMLKSEQFYADFQKKLRVARPLIKLSKKKKKLINIIKINTSPKVVLINQLKTDFKDSIIALKKILKSEIKLSILSPLSKF